MRGEIFPFAAYGRFMQIRSYIYITNCFNSGEKHQFKLRRYANNNYEKFPYFGRSNKYTDEYITIYLVFFIKPANPGPPK